MKPHRYLMDENPHFFYPTLAERLGLNEAIVLQQIHGWIQTYLKDPKKYEAQHWHDGAWWVWDSYPDWHKKLPYLSESTIKRTLVYLRTLGIVKVGNYNALQIDRTLWYTIDYEAYDKLWSDQETNVASPSGQNDQMEEANLTSPLPVPSSVPSSVLEEPASPDSPPSEEDDVAETEAMFNKTEPAVPRTAEQVKAGVQRALEAFHDNGGQRAGVADPTQDTGVGGTSKRGQHMADSWFAAQDLDLDTVPRDVQKDFARAMAKLSAPYESLSDEQACRAVEIVLDRKNAEFSYYTYSDPNVVKFKRDWAIVALRLLSGQTGYLTVQRKGGSSGPRQEEVQASGFRRVPTRGAVR